MLGIEYIIKERMVYFFMLQTKFVQGINLTDLNERLNQALSEITSKEPSIKYFLDDNLAIIEYRTNEAYQNRLCSECAHWEDTGNGTLVNFCTQDGKRKRYNCKACPMYKDLRDA